MPINSSSYTTAKQTAKISKDHVSHDSGPQFYK